MKATLVLALCLVAVVSCQYTSTKAFSAASSGVTKIQVGFGALSVASGFQICSTIACKDSVNVTVKFSGCDQASVETIPDPTFSSVVSGTMTLSFADPPLGSCSNFSASATITYPESVLEVCDTKNGRLFCADSYYRALPPDSPTNFETIATGYVYDGTQGLMWTADPIPGNYTNPNVPGRKDSITPEGDLPYVNAAKYYCGNMTYGGFKWRLPKRSEMHRLMDHGTVRPAINTAYFSINSSYTYWVDDKSPVQDYYLVAYGIYGSDGGITYDGDMNPLQGAFCVATVLTKIKPALGQYIVRSANVVHDSYTGLDWTKFVLDKSYPGPGIVEPTKYCEDMNVDGLSDWRLPAIKELVSIHPDNNNPRGPLWNQTVFDKFSGSVFWWASSRHYFLDGYYWAWVNGDGVAYINVSPGHARCIRGFAHQYDPTLKIVDAPIGGYGSFLQPTALSIFIALFAINFL